MPAHMKRDDVIRNPLLEREHHSSQRWSSAGMNGGCENSREDYRQPQR